MLVEETLRTCVQYLASARREETEDHRAKTYHSLALQWKLWMAVRWIAKREIGGLLQPEELCTKTG